MTRGDISTSPQGDQEEQTRWVVALIFTDSPSRAGCRLLVAPGGHSTGFAHSRDTRLALMLITSYEDFSFLATWLRGPEARVGASCSVEQ